MSDMTENSVNKREITIDYLLEKIEELSAQQKFLVDTVNKLSKLKSAGPGDVGTQEQAKAFGEIVKARENTNQKLIAFYEKMYDDMISKEKSVKDKALNILEKAADNAISLEFVSDMLDTIRHL